jgi:hypothetical protein
MTTKTKPLPQRYEIVELDPETGEEDSLLAEGTHRAMVASYASLVSEKYDEWQHGEIDYWPIFRLQPQA